MKINVAGCVQLKSCGLARWCFDFDNTYVSLLIFYNFHIIQISLRVQIHLAPTPSSGLEAECSARVYLSHKSPCHDSPSTCCHAALATVAANVVIQVS